VRRSIENGQWILSEHKRRNKGFRGNETSLQRNPLRNRRLRFDAPRAACHHPRVTSRAPRTGPSSGRAASGRPSVGRPSGIALDDVSKSIIEELQQDGRRSYAAIGKVVGLSEAAVRQRVQRLVDSGVMQVVAVTDPLELGFARQAMIGIRARGELEPIADAVAALDEVDYVVITAGSYDLLVEVVCESDEALLAVLSNKIRTIENVESTETFMYLQLRKQTYSWGVR
jgi:Lrp/AsnC family transcriptional regulator, regulator for asnA, asnC and gidA